VNSSAFSGLKHVEFLFLPAGVQTLASDAFNGLESVGLLKLAYLDLNELSPYTFRGLKAVRKLTIENSDLATVRANAFMGKRDQIIYLNHGTVSTVFLVFSSPESSFLLVQTLSDKRSELRILKPGIRVRSPTI
jgi:hypothetical protein